MPDFKAARTNMVDCQIHTAGVISPGILTAFETIPREKFVPANMQAVAYNDEVIPVGNGRFLLDPMTHAKMVQAVEPKPEDKILDIGGATGYSASILSSMSKDILALEENPEFLKKAEELWDNLQINNVRPVAGKLTEGAPAHAPFDLIFINGSITEIPDSITNQLAANGRIIAIFRKPDAVMGQATIMQKTGANGLSSRPLFESGSPYLPGFEPKTTFSF
jgi:protein-L-isoaspartate(D-aspartate) O-methyltransferase